jgi:hypothetical protein
MRVTFPDCATITHLQISQWKCTQVEGLLLSQSLKIADILED